MKKVALLIALMLIIANFSFAQELEASISGSGSVKWGVDLDTQATGFTNSNEASITLTLVEKSDTKGADADVYGEITLDGASIKFDSAGEVPWLDSDGNSIFKAYNSDGDSVDVDTAGTLPEGVDKIMLNTGVIVTAPSVTAKIILAPTVNVVIYSAPDVKGDLAAPVDGDDALSTDYDQSGGITLNVDLGVAAIAVEFASDNSWEATGNFGNGYAAKLDVAGSVDIVDFEVYVIGGTLFETNPLGLGAKVGATIEAIASVDFAIDTAFDLEATEIDIMTGNNIEFASTQTLLALADAGVSLSNAVSFSTVNDFDDKVTIGFEASGFSISEALTLKDLGKWNGPMGLGSETNVGYTTDMFGAAVKYELTKDDLAADALDDKLTVTLTATVIDNTTFTAEYVKEDVAEGADPSDKGIITLEAKVAY